MAAVAAVTAAAAIAAAVIGGEHRDALPRPLSASYFYTFSRAHQRPTSESFRFFLYFIRRLPSILGRRRQARVSRAADCVALKPTRRRAVSTPNKPPFLRRPLARRLYIHINIHEYLKHIIIFFECTFTHNVRAPSTRCQQQALRDLRALSLSSSCSLNYYELTHNVRAAQDALLIMCLAPRELSLSSPLLSSPLSSPSFTFVDRTPGCSP